MYKKYQEWLKINVEWHQALERLLANPRGFSFTVPVPAPELDSKYHDGSSYLHATRMRECKEDLVGFGEWEKDWNQFQSGILAYRDMGEQFHADVTDPKIDLAAKRDLLIASEADGHVFHNAAVLWLEHIEERLNFGVELRLDYEEVLKTLWGLELMNAHQDPHTPRCVALLEYCVGRTALEPVPTWNSEALPDMRRRSHVTLGKLLRRRKTQFHAGEQIRVHPGFWGLFLFSSLHREDRGFYPIDSDEEKWLNALEELGMPAELVVHPCDSKPNHFHVYERIPRLYADPGLTPPGVYLHRSKAHGRDDFLAMVWGKDSGSRKSMIICTKGVGADPSLVGSTTAKSLPHTERVGTAFANTDNVLLPFGYPLDEEALTAGSWRNMGFCLMWGAGHDEIAGVDFDHFGEMFDAARDHRFATAATGFVEPFVAIEISCVPRNKARMACVVNGVEVQKKIGYPVQVATLSPVETSLRLHKQGSGQDYDYGHLPLELLEWERCYAGVEGLPLLEEAIENDIVQLGVKLLPLSSGTEEQLKDKIQQLRRRMLLCGRILRGMLASYIVFVESGRSSDSYTGSFSGRNYNSGPRDSNEWGDLIQPSERQEGGASAGEGMLGGHIDLSNLSASVGIGGDLYRAMGLQVDDLVDMEDYYEVDQMWSGCALHQCSIKLTYFLGGISAKKWLDQAFEAGCDEVKPNEAVTTLFRNKLRSEAGKLPYDLGSLFE